MALKTLVNPHGKTFKMGRKRPAVEAPRMPLGLYQAEVWPKITAPFSYATRASVALSQIDLNDQLGDCVVAGAQHIAGVWAANAGAGNLIFSNADTRRNYGGMSGGTYPRSDEGCDEITALKWWTKNGLGPDGAHKIFGFVNIDASNPDEVMFGLWAFENLIFGNELPEAWVSPMPGKSGFLWDVAGDPVDDNGHCFVGTGSKSPGKEIDTATWGMQGGITMAAVQKYSVPSAGGELHAAISLDAIARASRKAPNGLDWAKLQSDMGMF